MRKLSLVAGFLCLLSAIAPLGAREWTDSTGKFKIEAEFVELKDGKVALKKADGTTLSIPLEKLSKADQDFIKTQSQPAASPFEVTSTPGKPAAAPMVAIKVAPGKEGKPGEVRRFPKISWGIASLAFSPNGGVLAAGNNDRSLRLYDVSEEANLGFEDDLEYLGKISACRFSPDGTQLLAGGEKGLIQIFDVSNANRLKASHQFANHAKGVTCIAVSSDSKLVVSGDENKQLKIWTLADGRETAKFEGFSGPLKAAFISPDGKHAYGTDGGMLLAIDLAKYEVLGRARLCQSHGSGQCAAFSPDGRWVTAGDSYAMRIWDLKNGREQAPLQDSEIQWSAAFTPDGTRLVSGGAGRLNVWDVKKQAKLAVLPTSGSYYVQTMAASPDNLHLAAIPGSAGQELQVFRLPAMQ